MALDGEHHVAFEAEFRAALAKVAETFDVDNLEVELGNTRSDAEEPADNPDLSWTSGY